MSKYLALAGAYYCQSGEELKITHALLQDGNIIRLQEPLSWAEALDMLS